MKSPGLKQSSFPNLTPEHDRIRPKIPCVILAGGRSRRFGKNKAFALLRGRRLIDIVAERLAHQTEGPIVTNSMSQGIRSAFDCTVIPDYLPGGIGPLAGIHAAMKWAHSQDFSEVITTPVDTPTIPQNFVSKMLKEGAPSVAVSANRIHAAHGFWPVALLDELANCVENGMRAARDWSAEIGAAHCNFISMNGVDPFFNVNTRGDLERLVDSQTDPLG